MDTEDGKGLEVEVEGQPVLIIWDTDLPKVKGVEVEVGDEIAVEVEVEVEGRLELRILHTEHPTGRLVVLMWDTEHPVGRLTLMI